MECPGVPRYPQFSIFHFCPCLSLTSVMFDLKKWNWLTFFSLCLNTNHLYQIHFFFLYTAVDQHGNYSHSHTSPSVTFTIQLKRHTTYYIVILFLPCFSNAMLTLLVFLLPPETGERIGVGINTLFTMWVNYLRVSLFS